MRFLTGTLALIVHIPMIFSTEYQCDNSYNQLDMYKERNYVHFIIKRQYCIARLQTAINALSDLATMNNRALEAIVTFGEEYVFTKWMIRHSLQRIQQTKTLQPLLCLWEDFTTYKCINDTLFVEEFSKEVLLIAQKFAQDKNESLHEIMALSCEEVFDHIDLVIAKLTLSTRTNYSNASAYSGQVTTQSDAIVLRMYHIYRLEKAFSILENPTQFTDIASTEMQQKLRTELQILLALWKDFKHYQFLTDHIRIKQFIELVLIFLCGHSIVADKPSVDPSAASNFNVEEMLNTIDMVTDYVGQTQQGLHDASQPSFIPWLLSHWWTTMFILGSLTLRAFYHYYQKASVLP
jgi:hypothetical protein